MLNINMQKYKNYVEELQLNNRNYYTLEPTELFSYSPINLPTNSPTYLPTYLPTNLKTDCPTVFNSTNLPTVQLVIENSNNDKNILIITLPIIFFILILFLLLYKYFYLKYKNKQRKLKTDELNLDFGLSYVDDF